MTQQDLFDAGDRIPAESVSRKKQPCTPAQIGSGPVGETCKTCKHYTIVEYAGKYRKCGLMESKWTHGPGTDIKAGWAACEKWERT